MIQVTNLVKKYGDHAAVDNISFTIEKGHIYGFLGPNGAGKSTTMNIITGCLAATSGTVTVDGYDIYEEPMEAKRRIGYLPELPPLYLDMTPKEYLNFVSEIKGIPAKERKAEIARVMAQTQITDMQNRMMKNLSKGYRQRVGFAQAILGNPDIIILDEPTVGLDPKQIIEVRDLIRSLGENHTVILSSHILSEVSAVCDRIMIIAKGKLVAEDMEENLSARLKDSKTVDLTVRADAKSVQKVLEEIPEIIGGSITSSVEKGCVSATVQTPSTVDIREKLFYAFAKAELPVVFMQQHTYTLEDIFLELTADTDTDELAAKEATKLAEKNADPAQEAAETAPADDEETEA